MTWRSRRGDGYGRLRVAQNHGARLVPTGSIGRSTVDRPIRLFGSIWNWSAGRLKRPVLLSIHLNDIKLVGIVDI